MVSIVRNSWCGCLRPPWAARRHRALEDLQERLLYALSGHVARDRRVVRLARDLVDLVDVDDPGLGLLDVEVGGLDQLEEDVLDVLADVAGLGQRRGVRDRERDVQDLGQRLGEQRLAAAGRPEQQDVRLLKLEVVLALGLHHLHALVVVVDRHRERALCGLLADHVLLQDGVDLHRLGQVLEVERRGARQLLIDDLVAEVDALSQMYTPGPAISFLTWRCDLPQKLHRSCSLELSVGPRGQISPVGRGYRRNTPPRPGPFRRARKPVHSSRPKLLGKPTNQGLLPSAPSRTSRSPPRRRPGLVASVPIAVAAAHAVVVGWMPTGDRAYFAAGPSTSSVTEAPSWARGHREPRRPSVRSSTAPGRCSTG